MSNNLKKQLRSYLSIWGLFAFSLLCLKIGSITMRRKAPFRSLEKLVPIDYDELPEDFFIEARRLNYGLLHRMISTAKNARKIERRIMRIGDVVLVIDWFLKRAFLVGSKANEDTIKIIGEFCEKKKLSVYCDPKYNYPFSLITPEENPSTIEDNLIVFKVPAKYPPDKILLLEMNAKLVPIKDHQKIINAQWIDYLFGGRFLRDGKGYFLTINSVPVGEIFLITGDKSDGFRNSWLKDDRGAEVFVSVKSDLQRKGIGMAISKAAFSLHQEKNPNSEIYWLTEEGSAAYYLAKKMGLVEVGILNRVNYEGKAEQAEKKQFLPG